MLDYKNWLGVLCVVPEMEAWDQIATILIYLNTVLIQTTS